MKWNPAKPVRSTSRTRTTSLAEPADVGAG